MSARKNSIEPSGCGQTRDWLLEMSIMFANSGLSQGITLLVGGSVVSGYIISEAAYFDKLAHKIENVSVSGPDHYKTIIKETSEAYRNFSRIYKKPDQAADDWKPPAAGYIHLDNARIFTANGAIPSIGAFLWRGRISSVDAWSLGAMKS